MYGHLISAAGSSLGSAVLGAAPALAAWKAVVDSLYLHTPAQAENATTGVIHIPDLTDVPPVSNATSGGSLCGVVACTILAAVGPPFIFTRNTRKTYKATPPPLPPSRPVPQGCAYSDKTITDDREEDAGGSGDPPPPPPPPPSEPDRLPEADKSPQWNWFLLTLAALNEVFTKRHRIVGLSDKTADGIPTHLPRASQLGGVCSNRNPLEHFCTTKGMPTVGLDRVPSGGRTNSHESPDILAPVWVFFPRAIAFFAFFGLLRFGLKDQQPVHEHPVCVDQVPDQESPNPPNSGSVESLGLQSTNITLEEGIASAISNTPPSTTSRMKLSQDQPMAEGSAFKLNPNVRPFVPSVLDTTSPANQGTARRDISAIVLSRREHSARNAALRTARHIPLPIQPPLLPRATPSFLSPEQTNSTPRDPLQNINYGGVFPFRQLRPSILHPQAHPGGVPRQCAPHFMSNMPVVTGTAQSSLSKRVSCGIPGDVPFAGDLSCVALPCKHLSHPPSLQAPSEHHRFCPHGWSPACGILCPLGLIDNLNKPSTDQSREGVQIARLRQSN